MILLLQLTRNRVRSGHGKSGKSMDFVFENSRPGNSMEVDEKFWKEVESFGKFLFRCTFDLTVSCHGQLVHFRSRRGRVH